MAKGSETIGRIDSQSGYEQALARLSGFFDSPPVAGSIDDEVFTNLMCVVESYEREHFSILPHEQHGYVEKTVPICGHE